MAPDEKNVCFDCGDCKKHYLFPAYNKKPEWVKFRWRCKFHERA